MTNPPLPDGWIQEYDARHKRVYWVDTKAVPPRSTWVHPFEDEQFLREHPAIAENLDKLSGANLSAPPPYKESDMRRHSWGGGERSDDIKKSLLSSTDAEGPSAGSSSHPKKEKSRGIFGKLKDKAMVMKEEHEEHKRHRAELAAQERRRNLEERMEYFRAHGGYAPYTPSYPGGRPQVVYGPPMGEPSFGGGGFGGGDTALLLGAGLVGGLLLGGGLGF